MHPRFHSLWQKTATSASTSRLSQWVPLTRYTQLYTPAKKLPAFTNSSCRPGTLPRTFSTLSAMNPANTEAVSRQDADGSAAAVPVSAPMVAPQQATDLVAAASVATTAVRTAEAANGVSGSASVGFGRDLAKALKAVVKVFTTSSCPNFSQPWQMHAQTKSTASGFIIPPLSQRRILTNAHAVTNAVMVMLRKHGNAKKFNAKILAVGHECDIAMLTVEDDEFWEGVEALEIHGLPPMQESVMVVGFPQGGDNVCVTKGVVSRLDRQQYSHGRTSLLAVQIDAAINSGNSGGPVLLGQQVVGIAFQCLTTGENIGYIIPVPVINHFLDDLKRHQGQYTGFCELGAYWQSLENTDMKAFLRMPTGLTGVYVTKVEPLSHAGKVLQRGDVITHFNGVEIADDATFLFQQSVRIDFRHLVSMHYQGDRCQVKIWRDSQHMEVEVEIKPPSQLVPAHSHDIKPSYFIYAGLLFTPLTAAYLKSQYGADWQCKAPIKLCDKAVSGQMEHEGQEIIVLSKVMAHDLNAGYQDLCNIQVHKVNGESIHNLAHLAQMLDKCTEDYVRFDLEWSKVVIINNTKAKAVGESILAQNAVPAAYNPGLLTAPFRLPSQDDLDNANVHEPEELEQAAVCKL